MYFAYYANFVKRSKYRACLSNNCSAYYLEIRSNDIQKFLLRMGIAWERNTELDFLCNLQDQPLKFKTIHDHFSNVDLKR